MKNILITGINGLIGDCLGQFPCIQELAKYNKVYIDYPKEVQSLVDLIPKKYNIGSLEDYNKDCFKASIWADPYSTKVYNLDIHKAFSGAQISGQYMSQVYYPQLGLETPETPSKADLEWKEEFVPYYDYLISPFARSLPNEQKWQQCNWQNLVDRMSNKRFALLGNSKYDNKDYIKGNNVFVEFDKPFSYICNLLKSHKSRNVTLISLVSGLSHLCFHINASNILLTNQGISGWGINPNAYKITHYIPDLHPIDVINKIKEIENER